MDTIRLDTHCFRIIDDLLIEIEKGLRGYDNELLADTLPLRGLLAQSCLEQDISLAFKNPPKGAVLDGGPQLIKAYLEFVKKNSDDEAWPLPVGSDKDYEGAYREVFDAPAPRMAPPSIEGSLLEGALAMAEWNLAMVHSRITAVKFLAALLPYHRSRAAQPHLDKIIEALYNKRQNFYLTYLKVVVMSGEAGVLEKARKQVFAKSFSERFGIMQYIEADQALPSRYSSDQEAQFRAELKALAAAPFTAHGAISKE